MRIHEGETRMPKNEDYFSTVFPHRGTQKQYNRNVAPTSSHTIPDNYVEEKNARALFTG